MTLSLGFLGPIGGQEGIIILIIILLLFGAKKLPELARGVGKSMGEFKKAREDFEREIVHAESEVTRRDDEPKQSAKDKLSSKPSNEDS